MYTRRCPKLQLSADVMSWRLSRGALQYFIFTPLLLTRVRVVQSLQPSIVRRMGNQTVTKGNDPIYQAGEVPAPKVTFTEEELRAKLTDEEYHVTQTKGGC